MLILPQFSHKDRSAYRPDPKDRGSEMEDYEISDIEPDHRDGGYFIQLFPLTCCLLLEAVPAIHQSVPPRAGEPLVSTQGTMFDNYSALGLKMLEITESLIASASVPLPVEHALAYQDDRCDNWIVSEK